MSSSHAFVFARDPRHLIVADGEHVRVLATGSGEIRSNLEVPELRATVGFDDEVWCVAGTPPRLTRIGFDGLPRGEAIELSAASAGPGSLVRAASGTTTVWRGDAVDVITLVGHDLRRQVVDGAAPGDAVVPLAPGRQLVSHRDQLALVEQSRERWRTTPVADAHYAHGEIIHDGRAAVLVGTIGERSGLVVVGVRDGRDQHRIVIDRARSIAVASRRGVALALIGTRRLVLVELRFGRVLADHDEPRDVDAVAIDDAGQDVAIRYVDGELVQVAVRELASEMRDAPAVRPAVSAVAPQREPAPAAAVGERPATPVPTAAAVRPSLGPIPALPARPRAASSAPSAPLRELQRAHVVATVAAAIARGWDAGTVSFAATGRLPHREHVLGALGAVTGLATDDLAIVVAAADVARAGFEAQARHGGAIANLAHAFGLDAVAQDLLLFVAAPTLWGEVAKLYGALANDEGRELCDEHLLVELLAPQHGRDAISAALDAEAPLRRLGIVRVDAAGRARPFAALAVDDVIAATLRGRSALAELAPLVSVRTADVAFGDLKIDAGRRHAFAEALARAATPLRIAVRGRQGAGRHSVLACVAAEADLPLGLIDAASLIRSKRAPAERLRQLLEQVQLLGMMPCVDGLEAVPGDDVALAEDLRDVLRRHPGPLAVRLPWDHPVPLAPGHVALELPALSMTGRAEAWRAAVDRHQLRVADVGELADRYAVGPGVVAQVTAHVAAELAQAAAPSATSDALVLDAAVRQHLEHGLGATATRVTRLANWSQVILPSDLHDSLTEFIARIKHRRIVFDAWGFDRLMATSRGVTALFQGGPGTGKTMVASAIANELQMDLYRVDLSRIMSKWIGETEQNLGKLFDAAEDGNAVILFDEADSLFAKRTEVRSSTDRYANLAVNYLLQRIDSFEGIAIMTTNFGTSIDSAFKRRLSLRLTFPFPDDEMRERLWRAHLPPEAPIAPDLDVRDLAARYQLSGGYIRNCTLRAAFLAAEEGATITLEHLERAIKAEFREIGKLADSGVLE